MTASPTTIGKQTAIALIKEAKAAGWLRAKIECRPDGSVFLDASMSERCGDDDFDTGNLSMSK